MKTANTFFSRLCRHPFLCLDRFSLADTGIGVDTLAGAVGKSELFCNADPGFVRKMLDVMTVRRVRAGEVILRQGRRGDSVVLLAGGQAEVTRARAGDRTVRQLAVLTRPEVLGEEALLGAEIRSVSVTMLTDGFVLKLRRSEFACLASAHGVAWLESEEAAGMTQPPGAWLWLGSARTRPAGMGAGVPAVMLDSLRQQLAELDPARHYLCCGRDDSTSALAAFLLTQRGFAASAVRSGRHAATTVPAARGR
jgi:CRP-like cAMP-binding protein